jgi:class 3 adenylate cyclase
VSGLERINEARPIELDPALLVTILQSARVARFIRSSTAVKISSKVNWFYILQLCNPFWYLQQCLYGLTYTNRRYCRRRGQNTSDTNGNNNNNPSTMSSQGESDVVSVSASATFNGLAPNEAPVQTSSSTSSPPSSSLNRSATMIKQASWTTLGNRALITVRMNNHKGPKFGDDMKGNLMQKANKLFFGRSSLSATDELLKSHLAAIRIQRLWRSVLHERFLMHDDLVSGEFSDVAWKGRISHSTIPSASIRVLSSSMKRSTTPMNNTFSTIGASNIAATGTATTTTGSSMYDANSSNDNRRRNESQVGSAMRELTGQRVAIGIIVVLLLTVIFTYTEQDATRPTTMIVLHSQTRYDTFAQKALNAARRTAVPDLFAYQLANGEIIEYDVVEGGYAPSDLRPFERLKISISTPHVNTTTIGYFSFRSERREGALVTILSTLFIVVLWFFGITAFAGPVMVLVVIPIERMVRLLGMLMVDPLGYQSTSRYKRFVDEESEITKNTRWTKEILKGMETSFLMSTILRIGSLMKVGFGSAGVEIIRNNLEKGQSKNMLILSSQGSTVSCIFLFCDIRNFTDATECLQEEVFVFTNRIAAVIHSNVHSYGGSANKNVGDAFLLSWLLDEAPTSAVSNSKRSKVNFTAKNNEADKCLLSVVRTCMALYHDEYYIGGMTDAAREALVMKLQHRKGPIVQMGFGMHAGRAVQGAIGSQRKIDATYVSEAVERAEFLESSTKKYGVSMLMSDTFHRLLHPSNRRRCRKIDQILIQEDDDDDKKEDEKEAAVDIMELFTFDIDVGSLWAKKSAQTDASIRENNEGSNSSDTSRRGTMAKAPRDSRRASNNGNGSTFLTNESDDAKNTSGFLGINANSNNIAANHVDGGNDGSGVTPVGDDPKTSQGTAPTLVLPTGPALYNANVWTSEDIRTMRQLYSDGLFFQNFMSGLQSYYAKDWDHATQCFTTILQRFEDGPSRYFLSRIEEHNGVPPKDFVAYGIP